MHRIKKLAAVSLSILTASGACVFSGGISAGASGTGAGLAEWALDAYSSGWAYVYGGSEPGAVDCSGLIYSYAGGARIDLMDYSPEYGSVSDGVPNIHGLGLRMPDHYGVYVGDGMAVDARDESSGVCYQAVADNYNGWDYWFKVDGVTYPTEGWEEFGGEYYYYENGEYIVSTSREIDGTTYYFDESGRSSETPSDTSSKASDSEDNEEKEETKKNTASSDDDEDEEKQEETKPSSYKNGSSGDEVEKIQTRLKELGFYKGEIDGEFGDNTEKAYKAFQKAAGLEVDGIAGDDREILYSDDAPYAEAEVEANDEKETEPATEPATEPETKPVEEKEEKQEEEKDETVQSGDFSDKVTEIQERLSELGYFGIDATGFFGDYTTEAIKNFQLENGLEATGELDEETMALLFSDDAVACPEPEEVEEEEAEQTVISESGPNQVIAALAPSELVLSNETNQGYADTASAVVSKTNKVTEKALAKSSSVIPSVTTAKVKRTANVWIWFILVAVILGAISLIFIKRDRKMTRYEKYVAKRKKNAMKSQLNTRW